VRGSVSVAIRLRNQTITWQTWFRSARVQGGSSSNDLRILRQRLCRVRIRHVPYFRRFVPARTRGKKDHQIFTPTGRRGPTPTHPSLNRGAGGGAMKKAEMLCGGRCGLLKCEARREGGRELSFEFEVGLELDDG